MFIRFIMTNLGINMTKVGSNYDISRNNYDRFGKQL
jgi:hypothetical protein